MNHMGGVKKKAVHTSGGERQKKQAGYLFFLLFATVIGILMVALFSALWSESAFFQWLLIGSLALLFVGAIAVRLVFHVHITTRQVVLWLTLIALAGTSFLGISSRRGLKRGSAALLVNSYAVSAQALEKRARGIEEFIRDIRARTGQYADMFLQMRGYVGKPRDIAERETVEEKLLLGLADGAGLSSISPEYIASRMHDSNFVIAHLSHIIPPYLAQGPAGVDAAKLSQYLKRQGMTGADFEEELEDALRAQVVMTLFPTLVYEPQVSVKRARLAADSARAFAVEHLSLDTYLAREKGDTLTPEAVKGFFDEQNRADKRYFTPEKRRGTVWIFTPEEYHLPLTDVEVRRYFADHGKEFGSKQLVQVRGEIENALVKEKFAKRFSSDAQRILALTQHEPEAFAQFVEKRKGIREELSWIERTGANSPKKRALFSIYKVGQKLVAADAGHGYIVMLDEIQASVLPPLESIRSRVVADLQAERARKALARDLSVRLQQVEKSGISALVKPQTLKVADQADWQKLEKQGKPIDRMQRMCHPAAAITQEGAEGGDIIALVSITPKEGAAAEKQDFSGEFNMRQTGSFAADFIASLRSSATIKKGGMRRVSGNFNDEE
ncbi:MAG: SurA N-terminal domain-containing protein [Candidatus Dependentiae bacterium]|nr:SurA N-terminal domain-containing protein [Candidatus Dependentiae bacterium]